MAAKAKLTPKVKTPSQLRSYAAKRNFQKTPEPAPRRRASSSKQSLRFTVHKHDARRLHFDLRLEWRGTLKCWAVPNGPSLTPGVRRLAVETEDHPIEYLDWEGVIPKGEYGGGTMILWDHGSWTPDGDFETSLKRGKVTFELSGERLAGKWTLVRMKDEAKGKKNWLLIKLRDNFALKPGDEEPADTLMTSVKSGASNQSLEGAVAPSVRRSSPASISQELLSKSDLLRLPGAREDELPTFVEPSLAVLVTAPPEGGNWIHEVKHDGYRIQARIEQGAVRLLTRKGLDWTARFPPVVKSLAGLPATDILIDGEIVVLDEHGQASFNELQRDLKNRRFDRLVLYAFDLLHCNGVDLRSVALSGRKRVLSDLISAAPASFSLRYNEHLETGGEPVLTEACKLGLEGIISKRIDLPYISGRGDHWRKSKCSLRQEFVVVGYVPSGVKSKTLGSLVLGYFDHGKLMHAGRAGTGFDADAARAIESRLAGLAGQKPEFGNAVPAKALRGVVWLRPELVAEIEYRGRSSDGLLRQAAFKGLREDKPAREVGLETARQPATKSSQPEPASRSEAAPAARPAFTFSHADRLLWPDAGVTKKDLGSYYETIAPWILPQITGRVLTLLRCPDGVNGACFFAKHAWMGFSKAVRLVDTGAEKPMLAIDDLQGLLTLVQMNVLEIHTWGSRLDDLEHPDRMIFDLDPGEDVAPIRIAAAARDIRDRLERLGLSSFVKSTGGKGLHVVVPLIPEADWEDVKNFSKAFAGVLAEDEPETYISVMTKSRRKGRIFVDYLRNGRGATAIAAYSTRARGGAPVALPLDWSEIDAFSSPFDIERAVKRVASGYADPWQDMAKQARKLPQLK